MKVDTYLFGSVEVSPEKIITFPNGMVGFEESKGFNYELALTDAENALLQSPAPEDVAVMQVLFKKEEDGKAAITPNLRAPLVINTKARVGLQKIMETMQPNIMLSNLV